MKKIIKKTILLICIILFAFFYAHISKQHTIYDKHADNSTYQSTPIFSEVTQSFISSEKVIDGFSMKMTTYGDVSKVNLKIRVVDPQTNKQLSYVKIKASTISSGKFTKINIPAINNCSGKSMIIHIISENSDINKGVGVSIAYEAENIQTEFQVNNNTVQGILVIKTLTNRFDFETFFVVILFCGYIYYFIKFLNIIFK